MTIRIAQWLERRFDISEAQTMRVVRRIGVALAAGLFLMLATMIVAFDDIFPNQGGIAALQVNSVAPRDIRAPESQTYISDVLTNQARTEAAAAVSSIYDPPDPSVARIQTQLAQQILAFMDDVRRDPFATTEQKIDEINQITALTLEDNFILRILEMDNDTWADVSEQIVNVLERVMRESIRDVDLITVLDQLPTQVSVRFRDEDAQVIVAIVEDLVRPNRIENPAKTEEARQVAINAIVPVERSFERGQLIVKDGDLIDDATYEALTRLGVLRPADNRLTEIGRAFTASLIVMVVIGLYLARFQGRLLYDDPRMLTLLAVIFLFTLAGARFLTGEAQVYIFPTAVMALLYVTIVGPEVAIIGTLGLAVLIGLMADNSLEFAVLVLVSGLIGTFTLRRAERLNSYFFAGLIIAMGNVGVVAIFNLGTPAANQVVDPASLVFYSLFNGVLAAAGTIMGVYVVTQLFNLPTALKLLELSQPNQPLLQRLLREAPGTYQHSLQVGNLAEQATNAIGGNAELVRVAALYHDIGKMLNPAFFTENQRDVGNPHDLLHDPYRSAAIIIGHVTEGDDMARQHRLPNRVRDFIREHHGTTQVYVFYRQAVVNAGGDEAAVDVAEFTYPGPKPQSRETAVLMLADSCEAAVRSSQPKNKKEIEDIVFNIIDSKRKGGQLDESNLTLNDLKAIHNIFIDILQAVFHPRINYAAAVAGAEPAPATRKPTSPLARQTGEHKKVSQEMKPVPGTDGEQKAEKPATTATSEASVNAPIKTMTSTTPMARVDDEENEAPLPDVPPLPRANDKAKNGSGDDSNGKINGTETPAEETEQGE